MTEPTIRELEEALSAVHSEYARCRNLVAPRAVGTHPDHYRWLYLERAAVRLKERAQELENLAAERHDHYRRCAP